ncbi:MAG: L,D-transpeptidase [Candidatus Pacebacteria bacterium]|jgi:lipoprotein-anchoring transpeptidase ErfK/SrfK|nr:L,D-transpeptidase [Candidatus Paceibacterota bacterium]MBP9701235.1 L,D-transpeptidase [Candidatus Paceibacterota bacterium]
MTSWTKKQRMTMVLVIIFGIGAWFYASYRNNIAVAPNPALATIPVPENPSPAEPITEPIAPTKGPSYHLLTTTTSTPGAELAKEVGMENVDFTLALNRLDVKHIPKDAVLVIPESFDDLDMYAPFPERIEAASSIPKLFIVSNRVQAFAAYENGTRVRWGAVSTGKKATATPSRLYSTNWKGKLVISTLEDAWVLPWYFNLDSMEGISMHQFDLPGYPASHSCIRLSEADAMWFYDWAQEWVLSPDGNTRLAHGTPVIIYGEYGYGKTAPWKKLAEDPTATTLSESELKDIVETYLPEIQIRATEREAILNPTVQ